jgi:uncharacterized protein (TIRG00374 family)
MPGLSATPKGPTYYLRLAISVFLFIFIFYKAGLTEFWQVVQNTRLLFLLVSILITPILVLISVWKWQVILRALKVRISLGKLYWLYIIGYFFNTVLPTNVGGDVVRAITLGKKTGNQAIAFSSVFIERFTGLSALLLMAIIAFFMAIKDLWNVWVNLALVAVIVGYLGIWFVLLNVSVLQFLKAKIKFSAAQKIFIKLKSFQTATLSIADKKGALVFAVCNSFLFYFGAVLNVYVAGLTFFSDLSIFDAIIITPIVLIISMLPLSIGGIGLAEGAYFFTFERLGLGGATGLSVALLMRAKALLAGVVGGIYYSSMGIKIEEAMKGPSLEKSVDNGDVEGEVNYYSGFEGVMRQRKSPLKKYQDIVMGNNSLIKLIKFDIITSLLGSMPGIGGYFLRKVFFKSLFSSVGKGTVFGKSVSFKHTHKIEIGCSCVIDEYCAISAQGDNDSKITLGNEVLLGRGTVLSTRNGNIEVGDFSNIGGNCRIGTTTHVKLGKHVLLAARCYIGGAQHRFDRTDIPIMRQGYDSKGGVVIEDDVWLGADVKVLDGVTIGTGSVVGAGSVVTKDLPPYAIAVGVPAEIKASRK